MLGSTGIGSDEREGYVSLGQSIQFALGLLSRFSQTLHGQVITRKINTRLSLESFHQIFQKLLVEVLSSKHGVSVGSLDLEDATRNFKNGNIEGTSTKIENGNGLAVSLVHTIRQCRSGGLIDDTQHVQACNFTSILGSLSLRIIKVGGHSNNSLGHIPSQESLSSLLHLTQNHTSNLTRTELLTTGLNPCIIVIVTLDNVIWDQALNFFDFRIAK
mmetsp:Transcript_32287/g.67886  ORF Transcript_32287/g.67886 Transcript_32287/m.67886 type:complete len:216 (+) Transcript_32287:392-1039(+)